MQVETWLPDCFGYERIAFAYQIPTLLNVHFQFAKNVSGMFHTIKDALPTFEEGQMNLNLSGNNNNNDQAENSNSISRSFLFPGEKQ